MTKKKVLITGSNGLIGKALLDYFQFKDKYDLFTLDKEDSINISSKEVLVYLNKISPNIVIHLAAHPGALSNIEPILNVNVNCLGSMHIIDWCYKHKAKFVFTSSSAVYGSQSSRSITENFKLKPETIYAVNKISVENWLQIISKIHKFDWTVFRLFPTYGFGHVQNTYQGIVNVFLSQIVKSKTIISKGSLQRERDLIYCMDVAKTILDSLENENTSHKIINLGTGVSTKVIEIIQCIIEIYGYSLKNFEIVEEEGFLNDPRYSICDPTHAKNLINFNPKYDLIKGLEDMFKRS